MTRETDRDAGLDHLLDEARGDGPDAGLMARVLADAEAVRRGRALPDARPHVRRGWLARIVDTLGGWGAVGGVTAAGVMGLSVGLYAPDAVAGWIGDDAFGLQIVTDDITPDMTELWLEGEDV